ncbi:MAG: translocation/assembly module TamB domain-containing protein [Gammaproteobacteria bacterium]
MRRRIFIFLGIALLFVVSVPTAAVYYIAYTEPGLQWLVAHIPTRIGRTQMEFVGASGTLSGGFRLERFELEHERVHLRFEGSVGHVRLLPLLWQTIYAKDVTMRSAYVEVRRWKTPPPKSSPRFLPRGLIIQADKVHVDAGTLIVQNGRRFDLTDVNTSGIAKHRDMRFYDGSFVQDAIRVAGKASLRAEDPMGIEGDARVLMNFDNQPPWMIAVSGHGNLDKLPLTAQFLSPLQATVTGSADDLTTNWHWSGKARVQSLDVAVWGGGHVLGRVFGDLDVKGDSNGFQGRGPLTSEGLRAGAFQTVFAGSYADRVVTASHFEVTHAGSRAHAEGSGTIAVVPGGPQLDLHGTWKDFRWPLVGEKPAMRSAAGEYSISGIRPFSVRTKGPMQAADLDPMQVEMAGKLANDRLTVTSANVEAFDGQAAVSGEVMWSPQERWSVTGDASQINPGRLREDLPGKLNFHFAAEGLGFSNTGDFSVDVRDLSGHLRGSVASGGGRIANKGNAWELDHVRVALGRTTLSAEGHIADKLDLRFALEAEDLSLLKQESRGRLRSQGTLHGTWMDPIVNAEVHGSGIEHEGVSLEAIDGTVDFDASGARPSNVAMRARNLVFRKRTLAALDFTLNGSAAEHIAHIGAKATGLTLESELSGAFAHGQWVGQMRKLNVSGGESLNLALASPVALALSGDHSRVEWFCLNGAPAKLCAEADWTPAKWSAAVNANELPIRTLTSGLTPSVDYRGELTVTGRAFGGGSGPAQGNLRADLIDAAIGHKLASGRTELITFGTGLVTFDASETTANATVTLDAGQTGTIKGHLEAQRSTQNWQDMPVSGEVHVQTAELGLITLYAPDIDRVAGHMVTDLEVSGTIGTPLLHGSLKLTDAELDLYQVNLAMRGAQLTANLHDNGLDFDGSARIGPGNVTTTGHIEWRDAMPYGKFSLTGQNLRVVDVPEAQIEASPSLDFKLDGRHIEVTGAVKVPYAKIAPADLTNAVRASSDEVMVGAEPEDPMKRFEVVTSISLTLGDKVNLDTFGLTARLTGTLALRSGTDEITRGSGELSIEEGKYTAYGRRLDIERGRLVFSGGPVNNPGVDIRAVKEYPDVKAGVNVRGTLIQPRLSFFSEPSLPQSQIVSLILAGGSIESAQNRNNPGQAGNELLAQGSAILAQQLGARVGLEDVSLESGLDNQTSLVLGKYLSSRLYVSYGISFTEQLNTLKLRYTVGKRWTIKTEVGKDSGADLFYTIGK